MSNSLEADGLVPRVLLVGPALTGGGAERRFWYLARHLFNGTADVLTLLPGDISGLNSERRQIGCLRWASEFSYPRMLFKLRRQVKRGKYDVLLGLGRWPNILIWAATRAMRSRPRILLCEI